jgi:hypothetical protein
MLMTLPEVCRPWIGRDSGASCSALTSDKLHSTEALKDLAARRHVRQQATMLINGKCHCGNIAFELEWNGDAQDIPARACSCSFCTKHGGVWTSNPNSKLVVVFRDAAFVSKYAFGTRTATFHVCSRCGIVPVVTTEKGNHLYAVVNVNAFENVDQSRFRRASADFEGEDVGSRLARRERNWIANVRIVEGGA